MPSPAAPAGSIPGWVAPIVVLLSIVVVALIAAVVFTNRRHFLGRVGGRSSLASQQELESGRITTGGEFSRYDTVN
jgi:hypothetical protein